MFEVDAVPYFPLKFTADGEGWSIRNPLTGAVHELNETAYWLLRLCDGYRTWGEIVTELGRVYRASRIQVVEPSEPLLRQLTDAGVIWWRRQRLRQWRLPPPVTVLWDLTSRCNLSCSHCVVDGGLQAEGELDLGKCRHLIDELVAFGVREVVLSGGEPLIRRDFFDIAEHAARCGLSIQIATNGTLITARKARKIATLGANVQVSLDGAAPETHDAFRRTRGAWERAEQGIRRLVAAGVSVTVAATVTKVNVDQIPSIYALAAGLGAHTFRILPFVPFGRGGTALELEVSSEEMRKVTEYLLNRRNEGCLSVAPMEFECTFSPPPQERAEPQTRVGCDGAVAYCTVTSCGAVVPCNFFAGVEAETVKTHSFAWIWENSRFLNYFRSLTVSDIRGVCQSCAWLPTCRGSCIAANFAHGDIFQSNCHCWLVNGTIAFGRSATRDLPGCSGQVKSIRPRA